MRFPRILIPALLCTAAAPLPAQPRLNDLEMAHVAVTASEIDIAYARLALEKSEDPAIRAFAETMIRDHSAVNEQVAALARRLNVQAMDNDLSRQLQVEARRITGELRALAGAAFNRFYAANELRYHELVNGVIADTFIPTAQNGEVRKAFEAALPIFRAHERHARQLVDRLGAGAP